MSQKIKKYHIITRDNDLYKIFGTSLADALDKVPQQIDNIKQAFEVKND